MAYKLNGNYLQVDVPFTVGDINYPSNWLRFSTADEKKAIGITEVDDPKTYDKKFYNQDGSAKEINDVNATYPNDDPDGKYKKGDPYLDSDGKQVVITGVKTNLKNTEKQTAKNLLAKYDWQGVRKAEKGTAIDTDIATYRDGIRTACTKREGEIDACLDTDALVNLYGVTTDSDGNQTPNMTQYPVDPNA